MELLKVETAWKKIELAPQPRTPKSQPRKRLLHEVVSPTRSEPNVRTPRPLNSEAIALTSPAPLAVQSPPAKVGPEETGTPRTDSKRRDSESPSVLGLLSRQEVWEQAIQQAKEEMKREHDRKLKEVEERTKRIQWKRKRMVLRKKRIEKLFSPWLDEDETPVMTVPTTDNTISHQQEVPHVEQPSPQTDPTDAPALTKEVIVPPPIPPSTVPDVTAAQPSVPPRAQSPPKLSHDVQTVTTQDTLSNTQVETTCNVQLKKGGVCGRVRPCRYHDAKDEGKKVETSKNPTESPAVVSQGGAITSESATPPVVPTSVPNVDTKPPPEEERRQDVDPVVTHPEPPQEIVATTSTSDIVIPTQSPLVLTTSELPKNHHHQQTFQISEMFIQPEPATDKRLDLHELIQTTVLSLPRHNHFAAGHQLQAKPWIKDFTNEDSTTTKSSSWCTTNVEDLVHYSLIYPISILQHNTNMIVLQHMYEDIDIVALFKNDIFGICFFHNGIFGDTFCSQVFEELRSFRSRPGQDLCNSISSMFRAATFESPHNVSFSVQFPTEIVKSNSIGRSPMEILRATSIVFDIPTVLKTVIDDTCVEKFYQPIFAHLLMWRFADHLGSRMWHVLMRATKTVPPILIEIRLYISSITKVILTHMSHSLASMCSKFLEAVDPFSKAQESIVSQSIDSVAALGKLHIRFLADSLHQMLLSAMFVQSQHLLQTMLHSIEDIFSAVSCSGIPLQAMVTKVSSEYTNLRRAVDVLRGILTSTNTDEGDRMGSALAPYGNK